MSLVVKETGNGEICEWFNAKTLGLKKKTNEEMQGAWVIEGRKREPEDEASSKEGSSKYPGELEIVFIHNRRHAL